MKINQEFKVNKAGRDITNVGRDQTINGKTVIIAGVVIVLIIGLAFGYNQFSLGIGENQIEEYKVRESYKEMVEVTKYRWVTKFREVKVQPAPIPVMVTEVPRLYASPIAYLPQSTTTVTRAPAFQVRQNSSRTIDGWTFSGIRSHLKNSPNHYVPESQLNQMSFQQMINRHNSDHAFGPTNSGQTGYAWNGPIVTAIRNRRGQ